MLPSRSVWCIWWRPSRFCCLATVWLYDFSFCRVPLGLAKSEFARLLSLHRKYVCGNIKTCWLEKAPTTLWVFQRHLGNDWKESIVWPWLKQDPHRERASLVISPVPWYLCGAGSPFPWSEQGCSQPMRNIWGCFAVWLVGHAQVWGEWVPLLTDVSLLWHCIVVLSSRFRS